MPSNEPDYTPVSGEDEAFIEDGMPSSFYPQRFVAKRSCFPRSYTFRRRMTVVGVIALFALAFLLSSLHLAYKRGHILTGPSVDPAFAAAASKGMAAMATAGRKLRLTTWNIAAINNNPFEYWITYDENENYEKLMVDIENFLENPGERDVPVKMVFTEEMFGQLEQKMAGVGWQSVRSYWDEDFKNRNIISGFMKDGSLGSKRLASMPDRITNTIHVERNPEPVCRPTVINMYDGDLGSMEKWWNAWSRFMFTKKLKIKTKDGIKDQIPYQMLLPIRKTKYPAISEQEEKDSLPLQTMCGAIFDAILVHMMNTVSEPDVWQPLKQTMVLSLNKQKVPQTLNILETAYVDSDVIMLQEVSSDFIDRARKSEKLKTTFNIIAPKNLDAVRDQNSVIMLNRESFPGGASKEITSVVEDTFPEGEKVVSNGDLLAITATHSSGTPFVVASFHGDTNGLATKPVLSAVMTAIKSDPILASHRLIFGLDANTYEHAKPKKQQDVLDWGKHYVENGLTSCWGDVPQPSNYTTFNARTYLQPQLNKACRSSEKREKGDVNPKDFILFGSRDFKVISTSKDNTGEKQYIEDMAFPTLQFPSDHGILSTIIEPKEQESN